MYEKYFRHGIIHSKNNNQPQALFTIQFELHTKRHVTIALIEPLITNYINNIVTYWEGTEL